MASGMGTRFGANKLMAKLNGIPLIQYVIQATESRFEKRVVVTRHDEVARLCHVLGAEAVLNNKDVYKRQTPMKSEHHIALPLP